MPISSAKVAVAFLNQSLHRNAMSDKELALDAIQQFPADAKLDAMAERLEFLAGYSQGG